MTTFHCTKLCSGECCVPLSWALRMLNSATMGQTYLDLANGGKPIEPGHDAKYFALRAAIDPAKVAELYVLALRARGFWIRAELSYDGAYVPELRKVVQTVAHYLVVADYEANCEEHELDCCIPDICEHHVINVYDGSLSEWRAKLLAIMQTEPNESSREACEQIVRGET